MIKRGMRLGHESLSQSSTSRKRTRDGFEIEKDDSQPDQKRKRRELAAGRMPPKGMSAPRPPLVPKKNGSDSGRFNFLGILEETNRRQEEDRKRKEEAQQLPDLDVMSPIRFSPEKAGTGSVSATSIGSRSNGFESENENSKIGFSWAMKCFGDKLEENRKDKGPVTPSTIPPEPIVSSELVFPTSENRPPSAEAAPEALPPIFVKTNAPDIQVQWVHHLKSRGTSEQTSASSSVAGDPCQPSLPSPAILVPEGTKPLGKAPSEVPLPSPSPPPSAAAPAPSAQPSQGPTPATSRPRTGRKNRKDRRPHRADRNKKGTERKGAEKRRARPAFNPKVIRVKPKDQIELTETQILKRQAQINLGKSTQGYKKYLIAVPKKHRRSKKHPKTPDVHDRISKRRFDGKIRAWRRSLHDFDSFELDAPLPIVLKSGTTETERRAVGKRSMDTDCEISADQKPPVPVHENLPGPLLSSFQTRENDGSGKPVVADHV